MQMPMMNTYFISHGSPTLAIEELPARHFLLNWDKVLQQKPKAILVISGHWETSVPTVNIVSRNSTIYDFYGFPQEMYKLQYDAPGAPDLAKRVKELFINSGFKTVKEDARRGLDHGAWVPLSLMYPNADIPVCQLSVQPTQSGEHHYKMGQALTPLKSEGVLIMGSGSATHNLRALAFDGKGPASWAQAFDNWLTESLINGRHDEVNHFEEKAPCARMAHPYPDHFFPLHVALGAAGERAKAELIHNREPWHTFLFFICFHDRTVTDVAMSMPIRLVLLISAQSDNSVFELKLVEYNGFYELLSAL